MTSAPDEPREPAQAHARQARPGIAAVTHWVKQTRAGVLAARERHLSLDLALSVGEHDRSSAGGLLGAALAFRLFLWVLPAALVLVGGLGFVRPQSAADEAGDAGLSAFTVSQIRQATVDAHQARWVVLLVGLFLLGVASVALARAVVVATAVMWGLPQRKPTNLLLATALVNALMFAGLLLGTVTSWLRDRSGGIGLGALLLTLLAWVLLWWAVSMFLPHPVTVGWFGLLPGALVFGVGVYALHLATTLYLGHRVATASRLYGAMGGAATLLLWAYLLSRLVIAAAAVNATWASRSSRSP